MGQVLYYRYAYEGRKLLADETTRLLDDDAVSETAKVKDPMRTRRTIRIFAFSSIMLTTLLVVGSAYYLFGMDDKADIHHLHVLPQLLGYASALLYCCSRVPQIMQNFRTESVEGLSLWMFVFSVAGNMTYCVVSSHLWEKKKQRG